MESLELENSQAGSKTKNSRNIPFVALVVVVFFMTVAFVFVLRKVNFQRGGSQQENGSPTSKIDIVSEGEDSNVGEDSEVEYQLPETTEIPTLEKISNCPAGVFLDAPGLPKHSVENNQVYGLLVEKVGGDNLTIRVEQIYDKSVENVDLYDVEVFEFREIVDRDLYLQGKTDAFRQVELNIGEPYTMEDIYDSLVVGSHVWIANHMDLGHKVFFLYCDAV